MKNTNNELKKLCLSLLHSDSEEEVISLLKSVGYWDDPTVWRLYGDKEGNYAQTGNQQAAPEGALVEKIVNSVDACLINKCLINEIDPESENAPLSIRHAVETFYKNGNSVNGSGGRIKNWEKKKRTDEAKNITLAATGEKKYACITITDNGEGQSPNRIPDTILSLNKKNKQRIKFVQGKYNMGGTGVFRHCHEQSLQLVISKRNPEIVEKWKENEKDDSINYWGFTIVRRVVPTGKPGEVLNSECKYLAPTNDDPRGVLRFKADSLPLLPEYNDAYARNSSFGAALKLYGYDMSAGGSNVLMKNGLLSRIEVLLPEIGLPVRIHECRKYFKGHKGSFDTNMDGLLVRIEDGKGDNLETDPWDIPFCVKGLKFTANIFVFKKKKSETYLKNEGIIFTINGQTHGHIPKQIFGRKKVGLPRLGRDLMVVVDCSEISVVAREDLFMSSRDRLSKGDLRKAIEKQLEEILGTDSKLRELQETRRLQEQTEKLSNERPLEEVLKNIMTSSPTLSTLFLKGQRLSMPKQKGGSTSANTGGEGTDNTGGGSQGQDNPFVGKEHPTYFRFKKAPKSNHYERNYEQERMVRVAFETDVRDGYFSRDDNRGRYKLEVIEGEIEIRSISHSLDLHDGLAQWSISMPSDVLIGEQTKFRMTIDDDVILEPITNTLLLTATPKKEKGKSVSKKDKKTGQGSGENKTDVPSGMELPDIVKVNEGDNNWEDRKFDNKSGCAVIGDLIIGENGKKDYKYTFYVNISNIHLQNEMKTSKEPELEEAKYVYGNVLLGLALIHQSDSSGSKKKNDYNDDNESDNEFTIENNVKSVSRALSPFLVPMINYLGNLSSDEVTNLSMIGDDD